MYSTDYTGMYLTGMYYDIIYRIVGKCTVLISKGTLLIVLFILDLSVTIYIKQIIVPKCEIEKLVIK